MLEYVVVKVEALPKKTPTLIILHGYGADEYDLISVAQAFPPLNIISIRAPIELPWGGYAWYHLEQTADGLRGDEVTRSQNEELLRLAIIEILEKEQLDKNNIILLGFSQGAAMSYSLVASPPDGVSINALIALSGYVPFEIKKTLSSIGLNKLPVFISHGEDDDLISPKALDEAAELLRSAGSEVTANKYAMGHSVSNEVISDLKVWFGEHF